MKQPGQSLVEMAIIAPLLIFMLLGVFEVGWALRGYLILANANREAARFAIRPGYLNFETATEPGWDKAKMQAINAIGGMLPLNFEDKGTLLLTYIAVDTGRVTEGPDCATVYTSTIKIPADYPTYTITYGEPRVTHFDFRQMTEALAQRNRLDNCSLAAKGGVPRSDGMIIIETWYEQPMLFGFPLISNAFTDPVPLYASTIMRRIEGLRSTGQGE